MQVIKPVFLLSFFFLLSFHLKGQERCGISHLHKLQNRPKEADQQFERWIQSRARISAQETKDSKRTNATYTIPVVVHVIHKGESVGSGTNISNAQILSQLKVINNDFKRLNNDASNTPSEFASVAGSMDIEFVLAKQTPDGLPTDGIVRVQGSKTSWSISDNYTLKSLSYWPAEDYLNIWVCNLTDYLGYAQFPQTTLVSGLENASSNRLTDGVVVTFDAFGSIDDGPFNLDSKYNKGRTATHEIGHFFGLRHIWGDDDGSCGGNGDYVSDTPDQGNSTSGCPSHPNLSCSTPSMFQNFLDYTNDACMNLFTEGQVQRMRTIIENSPRRKSLQMSRGLLPPTPVANDLGIREVVAPSSGECSETVIPSIVVGNLGNNPVNSATIRLSFQEMILETKEVELNLPPAQTDPMVVATTLVTFAPYKMTTNEGTFRFEILETNGDEDGSSLTNLFERHVVRPEIVPAEITEDFSSFPNNWRVYNPDGLTTWSLSGITRDNSSNTALKLDFYDYEDSEGEVDAVITPIVDLTGTDKAVLFFEVSHAQFENSKDKLKVVVLNDCNPDITSGITLYEKAGSVLSTLASPSDQAFLPRTSNEWRTESISLEEYLGQSIQLAFVGINDWGNNLYLDNVQIKVGSFKDVLFSPNPVGRDDKPKISVRQAEKGDIIVHIIDFQGREISRQQFRDVFNEDIVVDFGNIPNGIYILKAIGEDLTYTTRVVLAR